MSRDSVTGAAVLEFTINNCLYIKKQFGSKVFFNDISLSFQRLVTMERRVCQRGGQFFTSLVIQGF